MNRTPHGIFSIWLSFFLLFVWVDMKRGKETTEKHNPQFWPKYFAYKLSKQFQFYLNATNFGKKNISFTVFIFFNTIESSLSFPTNLFPYSCSLQMFALCRKARLKCFLFMIWYNVKYLHESTVPLSWKHQKLVKTIVADDSRMIFLINKEYKIANVNWSTF